MKKKTDYKLSMMQDALCRTELELMELLDVSLDAVSAAVVHISQHAAPPCHTVRFSTQ